MDIDNIRFDTNTKMGEIRKVAKEVKIDHNLSLKLWSTGKYHERLLAILIMDKKELNREFVDSIVQDISEHDQNEQLQLMDWFFANQLSKSKHGIELIQSWKNSELPLQRRTFWYHQARKRWMGKSEHSDTEELLSEIELNISNEEEIVQWAMNFLAGWIGVYEEKFRERCINLGRNTGLYKNQKVSRGCTPDYLPEFIRIESEKHRK
ncbi:DNA alkylation repair protein [Peptostreptococcus porci]|uniref:DNA alkylation repair protein n=1 Tax=Peptostreptococcus porci TaxID=2652282 RepID=UPI002A90BD19|nr:DNA alkylation repair protein [Peptostreptococcus porci]MDY5437015.1 DNA alkylation repair protein [Peptostreptococcus porci]